ncbi:MAG: quinone-dependent dihydroorotate dehydrogenase [Succinivibrio sp.]|nr:quinone-dependent dihydroorotate dehydrogenase [Succinivibrio sp.]
MILYNLYSSCMRPLLFMATPERAHNVVLGLARILSKEPLRSLFAQKVDYRPCEVMGLQFSNPVGLAAGLDKDGDAIDYFGALGFGFIEVGTVTPRPQKGNPKPRMFRIYSARGIINRMGFNNRGVDYLVKNLKKRSYSGIVGVSIGKNEDTPLEKASEDYLICMDKVYPYCDYISVNVSCPNTPDLTKLQQEEELMALLKPLKERQAELTEKHGKYVPLVVKISPDLYDHELQNVCSVCVDLKIDGINCTNTTVSRSIVHGMLHVNEWGGLSGEPLYIHSTRILRKVNNYLQGAIPLIGVGGISGPISAREKLYNGASLVQIYTSLVYQGPSVVKQIVNNL